MPRLDSRDRRIHFVIHNQGDYDQHKKIELLDYLVARYPHLEAYCIAQEHYTATQGTHLQGNLFFKNPVTFSGLLKHLQKKYKEVRTEDGLVGRIQIEKVRHEGKAMNYMVNEVKDGGDPTPLMDMDQRQSRIEADRFHQEVQDLIVHAINVWRLKKLQSI